MRSARFPALSLAGAAAPAAGTAQAGGSALPLPLSPKTSDFSSQIDISPRRALGRRAGDDKAIKQIDAQVPTSVRCENHFDNTINDLKNIGESASRRIEDTRLRKGAAAQEPSAATAGTAVYLQCWLPDQFLKPAALTLQQVEIEV